MKWTCCSSIWSSHGCMTLQLPLSSKEKHIFFICESKAPKKTNTYMKKRPMKPQAMSCIHCLFSFIFFLPRHYSDITFFFLFTPPYTRWASAGFNKSRSLQTASLAKFSQQAKWGSFERLHRHWTEAEKKWCFNISLTADRIWAWFYLFQPTNNAFEKIKWTLL